MGKNYFGVTNISKNTTDLELDNLNNNNIVAVRFKLKRGVNKELKHLEYLSDKLFENIIGIQKFISTAQI